MYITPPSVWGVLTSSIFNSLSFITPTPSHFLSGILDFSVVKKHFLWSHTHFTPVQNEIEDRMKSRFHVPVLLLNQFVTQRTNSSLLLYYKRPHRDTPMTIRYTQEKETRPVSPCPKGYHTAVAEMNENSIALDKHSHGRHSRKNGDKQNMSTLCLDVLLQTNSLPVTTEGSRCCRHQSCVDVQTICRSRWVSYTDCQGTEEEGRSWQDTRYLYTQVPRFL